MGCFPLEQPNRGSRLRPRALLHSFGHGFDISASVRLHLLLDPSIGTQIHGERLRGLPEIVPVA